MRGSGFNGHYEPFLSAGAKAKTVTSLLIIPSVLAVRGIFLSEYRIFILVIKSLYLKVMDVNDRFVIRLEVINVVVLSYEIINMFGLSCWKVLTGRAVRLFCSYRFEGGFERAANVPDSEGMV